MLFTQFKITVKEKKQRISLLQQCLYHGHQSTCQYPDLQYQYTAGRMSHEDIEMCKGRGGFSQDINVQG